MRCKFFTYFLIGIVVSVFVTLSSCSTKKNTMVNRTYHNVTSYYNVYYNGNDAFKAGVKKIDDSYKENYSLLLPIFRFSNNDAVREAFGDMNRAIEKGSKCIRKHSITEKPKRKEGSSRDKKDKSFYDQKQFVKWIDNAYLLIGKAQFYKHDFYAGIETFSYIVREYKEPDVRYEAYLWLARTYIEMNKFDKALDFLAKLETEKVLVPKHLIGPLALTEADLMIRQKQYDKAIPFMRDAIAYTKKKKEKARNLYILAQLYEKNEEKTKAFDTYGKVIDLNQTYEMTFNARINQASIFNSASADSRPLQRELQKMLRDDKNIDYRDQIYYALGNIAYNESKDKEAIEYFLLSANVSTQNNNQKAMSYLAAADIFFIIPDYRNAQAFYDSAVSFLTPEYPDYLTLKNKSQNLNQLVENILIIENEDSLLRIAALPESQRNDFVDQLIAKVIEKERQEKELQAQEQKEMAYLQQQGNEMEKKEGTSWYFYNQNMLAMGFQEFKKKWGDRKLEDNWRRKNKSTTSFDEMAEEQSAGADSAKQVFSNKSREFYLVGLPLTDSAKQVSNQKIEQAYFNMAGIYKEKLNDFNQSIDGYLKLLEKFPQTEFRLSSYYNLYKLYFLLKDYPKADNYKALILAEYPDSEYAKVLGNPDYFKELEKIDNQVKFLYQATYKYFLNSNCTEVQNNYRYVDSMFHESSLLPKFALLNALCNGNEGDTLALKSSLEQFKLQFPKSNEVAYADEVLAALERKPREVELAQKPKDEFGVDAAIEIDSVDLAIYTFNPQKTHYYLLVLANKKVSTNSVQFKLTNFNLDYFSYLEFDVSNELLSADYTCVVVKKFKNRNMANNYFESVIIAGEVLDDLLNDTYRSFIISDENYTAFLKDKNLLKYQKFFELNYKKP